MATPAGLPVMYPLGLFLRAARTIVLALTGQLSVALDRLRGGVARSVRSLSHRKDAAEDGDELPAWVGTGHLGSPRDVSVRPHQDRPIRPHPIEPRPLVALVEQVALGSDEVAANRYAKLLSSPLACRLPELIRPARQQHEGGVVEVEWRDGQAISPQPHMRCAAAWAGGWDVVDDGVCYGW